MDKFIKANRAAVLSALKSSGISRRIDKMDLHREYKFILLDDAKAASKEARKTPRTTIHCKVYVTHGAGVYGYQFLAALWVSIDGQWHHASGSLTGGYGYDKESEAVTNAFRAIGLNSTVAEHFGGTGQHEQALSELMAVLAGRKAWFQA